MKIDALIEPGAVIAGLGVSSKRQALQELSAVAAQKAGLNARSVFDMLLERERLGPTGVGEGVAIPHARPDGLDHIFAIFARLDEPIDFDAADDQPVDLIFLLLAPESAGADHLKALARIAKLMRDAGVRERIRAADDAAQIHDLLVQQDGAAAAE